MSIMASMPLLVDLNYLVSFEILFHLQMSLMIHGVESDWIEEEMADDDDFR